MKTIYLTDFRYGKANLAKAKLVKETPKILFVQDHEDVLGWVFIPKSGRVAKNKYGFFLSGQQALAHLIKQAEKHVEFQQKELDNAIREHARLRQIAKGEDHDT